MRFLWLFVAFLVLSSSVVLARTGEATVREVRTILPSEWGVPYPAGLAYSDDFNYLFLLDKSNADHSTSEGATVVTITPLEDLVGTVQLEFVVDDAINAAFDDRDGRLFLLNNEWAELAQIGVDGDGILDPATQARFDVARFGLDNAQGMNVDVAGQYLFILDSAALQIVRVALDGSGFDEAEIATIDLSQLGVTDLRGIAVHPINNHLYILSPTEQELFELTQSGQPVATYDLADLNLIDPGGLAFAPSADLTDPPDTIHLFIADSNLPDNQPEPGSGVFYLPLISWLGSSNVISEYVFGAAHARAVRQVFGRILEVALDDGGRPDPGQPGPITASVETDPVPNSGDAADDPAIWVHPTNPSLSTIIGSDKQGGLAVYDLNGHEIQYLPDGRINNLDLHYNFPLGGESVALVGANNKSGQTLLFYRVNPNTRRLENVNARTIESSLDTLAGACMYHSPVSGKYYLIVNDKVGGDVEQWELSDNGSGRVDATLARTFSVGVQTEGCVVDDELAHLYIASEDVGIWKYGAEPDDTTPRTLVDTTGSGGHLTADVEGLSIYYTSNGAGYLIASSQGSDEFVIYRREGNNDYLMTFSIAAGNGIDEVTNTDGIEVMNRSLGPAFPFGVFVAQDGQNDGSNQNFKLVPWELIAHTTNPPLTINTTHIPHQGTHTATPAVTPTATDVPTETPTVTPTVTPSSCPGSLNTISVRVSTSTDDSEERSSGTVDLTSSDLELVETASTVQTVGIRFQGVAIPPGTTITNAYIEFETDEVSTDPASLVFRAEAVDHAAQFIAAKNNVSRRRTTVASVSWSNVPAWNTVDEKHQTPDLSPVVQAVVDRSGWASGNAMVFMVTGTGTRTAEAYDGEPATAPRLVVEFCTSS